MLAGSGQFHPSTSCRGRLTKFHPSALAGYVHSSLLDDFELPISAVHCVNAQKTVCSLIEPLANLNNLKLTSESANKYR